MADTKRGAHKPSDPARAVEALDRIYRHAADSALLKIDHKIAVYEIVQVLDAWVSGDDWYETLRSKELPKEAK